MNGPNFEPSGALSSTSDSSEFCNDPLLKPLAHREVRSLCLASPRFGAQSCAVLCCDAASSVCVCCETHGQTVVTTIYLFTFLAPPKLATIATMMMSMMMVIMSARGTDNGDDDDDEKRPM